MRRLINADLWRISMKRPLWIVTFLFMAFDVPFTWYCLSKGLDKGLAFTETASGLSGSYSFVLGFVLLSGVYSDEYRNMTMIATIGRGISRKKYVLAKFLDGMLLTMLCFSLFAVFSAVLQLAFSVSLSRRELFFLAMAYISDAVSLVACMTMASIAFYLTHNVVLGVIAFLTVTVIIPVSMQVASLIPFIARFRPDMYSLDGVVSMAKSAFIMGNTGYGILISLAGIAVYIVAALILSMIVFEKKELDF